MTTIYVIVYDYLREVSSHYTRTWTPSVRATGCSRACENVDHMRREVGENSQGIPARTEAALRRASCAGELVEWILYSRRIEHATDEGDDLWEGAMSGAKVKENQIAVSAGITLRASKVAC